MAKSWQETLEEHDYDFEAASEAYNSETGSGGGRERQPVANRDPTKDSGPEFGTPTDAVGTDPSPEDLVGTYTGTRQELPDGSVRTSPAGEKTPDMPPAEDNESPDEGQSHQGGGS